MVNMKNDKFFCKLQKNGMYRNPYKHTLCLFSIWETISIVQVDWWLIIDQKIITMKIERSSDKIYILFFEFDR